MALGIPDISVFTSLVGALCLSMLGFTFPALIEICVIHPDQYGFGSHRLIRNVLLIIFGLFAMVMGSFLAIRDLVDIYKQK